MTKQANLFPDRPAWRNVKQFLIENGTDSASNRLPSPDKITSPRETDFY